MILRELKTEIIQSAHDLSVKDRLYLILLAGAVIRSIFVFVNFDSKVYQMWLQYFLKFGTLPYFDHPPLFFLVSGGFTQIFQFLQSISPYYYWPLAIVPFTLSYYFTRERSPYLFALLGYLTIYVFFIGYLGNLYELAMIVSVLSGVIFIYIAYLVGNIISEVTGLYAALFTAFSWWPVVYSNILLIDMFASALIASAYYSYYLLLKKEHPEWRIYVVTTVLLSLAFYTKYYALLLVPVISIYAIYITEDWRSLIRKSVPGVIASFLFLAWGVFTSFYFLDHYATSHYLFLEMPGLTGFGFFLLKSLTPFFLAIMFYGAYNLRTKKNTVLYLLLPIIIGLSFHIIQVFVFRRSHSLINLTNYILYSFPFIAATMAKGWSEIDIGDYKPLVTVFLLFTLITPLFGQSIITEYGGSYTAPANNMNSLTSEQIESLQLSDEEIPTLHFVYKFNKRLAVWSDFKKYNSHFRWESPTSFNVVSLEGARYKLVGDHLKNNTVAVYKNGEKLIDYNLGSEGAFYVTPGEGFTSYSFETENNTMGVVRKVNCGLNPSKCNSVNNQSDN